MTATDVLRRLLDERGVEYMKVDFLDGEHITSFDVNGREYGYHEFPDGGTLLRVWHPTPEQAIAVTLDNVNATGERQHNAGTCHIDLVDYNRREDRFQCRSCDWSMWFKRGTWPRFNFCPNCGRKVIN